jgi:hypothetical protein
VGEQLVQSAQTAVLAAAVRDGLGPFVWRLERLEQRLDAAAGPEAE